MQVGQFYKHKTCDLVLKCTKSNKHINDTFCGYVVKGDGLTPVGFFKDDWLCFMFDPYFNYVADTINSTQIGGDHYNKKAIQPIDYIIANDLNFCEGNVVKYITRYKDKNGVEDLKKAKQYIDFLIKDYESKENI